MNELGRIAGILRFTLIVFAIVGLVAGCAPPATSPAAAPTVAAAPPTMAPAVAPTIELTPAFPVKATESPLSPFAPNPTVAPWVKTAIPEVTGEIPAKGPAQACCNAVRNSRYEENEVIFTGPSPALPATMTVAGYELNRVSLAQRYEGIIQLPPLRGDGLDLSALYNYNPKCKAWSDPDLQTVFGGSNDVGAFLYEIADAAPGAVEKVVETSNPVSATVHVIADANWTTTPAGDDPCIVGSPNTIGGSPWTQPSCGDQIHPGMQGPTQADFLSQWALLAIDGQAAGGEGGGVDVGVFDTWPSPTQAIKDWELSLFDTRAVKDPIADQACLAAPDWMHLGDHGLAVAGLVKAVAPGATISAYRVLGDDIHGRVLDLDVALAHFLQFAETPAVINLSLGVMPQTGASLNPRVVALKALLAAAYCRGIPVVAASGNYGNSSPAPQVPAAWSSIVISAAASNQRPALACFSNPPGSAGFMAPGGDGDPSTCRPATQECFDRTCPYGVISLVSDAGWCGTDYAYWAGTSFATPLISGQVALCLQANEASSSPWQDAQTVDEIRTVQSAANGYGGLINVQDSTALCTH
jgi:hypothetical protein